MNRHGLKLTSLLIALTFQGTVVFDATGLHGCPQHDALPAAEGMAAVGHDQHKHAGHGAAAQHQHGADHEESHEGPCTCIGNCHVGGEAQVALDAPLTALPSLAATLGLHLPTRAAELLPGDPPHLLPYSQAPPTLA